MSSSRLLVAFPILLLVSWVSCSNKFGVGLVTEGTTQQISLVKTMAGDRGWILLLFAGLDNNTFEAPQSWKDSVQAAHAANLSVAIRLSPPWGQQYWGSESDNSQHLAYTHLANAIASVVKSLPISDTVYLQIDNEPDLCYEWFCQTPASPESFQTIAAQYAYLLRDVVAAIRSLNNMFLKVGNAGLAPGGNIQCGCCGSSSCNQDQGGITGLQFLDAMKAAVPTLFTTLDFFATHSYPASGIGYGFNAPYDQASPGLTYFRQELQHIGVSLPVLVTETGWALNPGGGEPTCTEQQKADWTVAAYTDIWLTDPNVLGVMPFMLQDQHWGDQVGFGYVLTNGQQLPVYNAVQALRCHSGIGPC